MEIVHCTVYVLRKRDFSTQHECTRAARSQIVMREHVGQRRGLALPGFPVAGTWRPSAPFRVAIGVAEGERRDNAVLAVTKEANAILIQIAASLEAKAEASEAVVVMSSASERSGSTG